MRGRELNPKEVRRLLRRLTCACCMSTAPDPTEVSETERQALLDRVEQFFAGEAPPMCDFRVAEFRDSNRRVLLAIEEGC